MKTGVAEWAQTSFNLASSDSRCTNGCLYCFAKEHENRFGYIPKQKPIKKYPGVVMFPTRHDITPDNINEASDTLMALAMCENDLLIVTKPHLECIERICKMLKPCKDRITWRFSIGSASDSVIAFWEPGATLFAERVQSLACAWSLGYKTSVSMEPMLDTEPDRVIEAVSPFVNESIWIGLMRRAEARMKMNGIEDKQKLRTARTLTEWWGVEELESLQARLKNCPLVKWKDSIKIALGLESR